MIEALKVYDPIKGGDVLGNILDQVHSPTYNLKLYMMNPVGDAPAAQADERNPTASGRLARNPLTADPKDMVVLAQTGVTGAQIDNLSIVSVPPTGGASIAHTQFSFQVIQPGAVDFIDQMIAAKKYLGIPSSSTDFVLVLEIVFKGYSAEPTDEDLGGEPIAAAGPYRFLLTGFKIEIEITPEGSTYDFKGAIASSYAYADPVYRVPKKIETIGTTIEEHVADFEKKFNDYIKINYTNYKVHDEIKIDISGLKSPSKYGLSDLSIVTDSEVRAEEINRIMNPELEGKTEAEYKAILEAAAKDEGKVDIVVSENKITVREGITVTRYITTLLSMNNEFFAKISRKVNPKDPADATVDKTRPYVNWVKMNTDVGYLGFDTTRNMYAKKIIFKPVIYASTSSTVQIHPDENKGLNTNDIRSRISAMNIQKAYHYMYTGLNDQILNCNIRYDAGLTVLNAPAGGMTGEFSTVMAKTLSSEAAQSDDMTGQSSALAALGLSSLGSLIGGIDAMLKLAKESDIAKVGSVLGMRKDQIADAITNKVGLNAKIIKDALSVKSLADEIFRQVTNSTVRTSSDNFQNIDGTVYTFKPKNSQFVYAADLIHGAEQRGDPPPEPDKVEEAEESSEPENQSIQGNNPNLTEDATYDGSPKNTIFGYLMQQQYETSFLQTLDLEIKGDPWYLGPIDALGYTDPDKPGSDAVEDNDPADGVNFLGDDINIVFDMQFPRRYDFDVTEEDNNTGYWSQRGTSYFITGIYKINKITHEFSGGEFKQIIQSVKNTALHTSKLEPQTQPQSD